MVSKISKLFFLNSLKRTSHWDVRCACGHRVCGVFRHWWVLPEAWLDHNLPGRPKPWHAEIQERRPPAADVAPLLVLAEGKMWRQEYGSQLSIYVCWPPGWRWEAASSSWAPPPGGVAAAGRGSGARCARRTLAASAPRCCRSRRSTPAATLRTNTLCYANTVMSLNLLPKLSKIIPWIQRVNVVSEKLWSACKMKILERWNTRMFAIRLIP